MNLWIKHRSDWSFTFTLVSSVPPFRGSAAGAKCSTGTPWTQQHAPWRTQPPAKAGLTRLGWTTFMGKPWENPGKTLVYHGILWDFMGCTLW